MNLNMTTLPRNKRITFIKLITNLRNKNEIVTML